MRGKSMAGLAAALILLAAAAAAPAITVVVDYSLDATGLFAVGSLARPAVEAAADYYSQILDDTFLAISTPPPFTSSLPPVQNPGTAEWEWTMTFNHPSLGMPITLVDQTIASDEYRIFIGGKSLPGDPAGQSSLGGWGWQSFGDECCYTSDEVDQLNAMTAAFAEAVETRGQPTGFSLWGASISFDTDADVVWHFDFTSQPLPGTVDLFSVALHEIGHALGLGSSNEWNALAIGSGSNAVFVGPAAMAEYGSSVPLAFNTVTGGGVVADKTHWREQTMSQVFGATLPQEAAMDPSLIKGTRKLLTALDAAAMTDIGWTVIQPSEETPGDYNGNGVVDAADYTVWRDTFGQTGTTLAADGTGPTGGPDGVVDQLDYQFWKAQFVATPGGGAGAEAIPEPLSFVSALLAAAAIPLARRRQP